MGGLRTCRFVFFLTRKWRLPSFTHMQSVKYVGQVRPWTQQAMFLMVGVMVGAASSGCGDDAEDTPVLEPDVPSEVTDAGLAGNGVLAPMAGTAGTEDSGVAPGGFGGIGGTVPPAVAGSGATVPPVSGGAGGTGSEAGVGGTAPTAGTTTVAGTGGYLSDVVQVEPLRS